MDACSHQAEPSTALKGLPEAAPGNPGIAMQPLAVSGLVVSTAALVAALRPYLPRLVAIEPLGSGQFLLRLAGDAPEDNGFKEEETIMTDCGCTNFPASLGDVTFGAAVGIGTAAPVASLDVSGGGTTVAAYVGPTDDNQGALVLRGGTADTAWALGHLRSTDPSPNGFALVATEGGTATPVLVASLAGQVGLGTDTPTELLHLQGGSLYINGGNILVSGDVTTGVGAFYATSTKVADSGGCYYS